MTNAFSGMIEQLESIKHVSSVASVGRTSVTGVGNEIKALIREGRLTNKQILEQVLKNNPARKTTYACVAWYQSDLRKKTAAVDNSAADAYYAQELTSLRAV